VLGDLGELHSQSRRIVHVQADPLCSFGDFVAVSDEVDIETAKLLKIEASTTTRAQQEQAPPPPHRRHNNNNR